MKEGEGNRFEFYSAQYAPFGTKLAGEIRQEIYGTDLQGSRTLDVQAWRWPSQCAMTG